MKNKNKISLSELHGSHMNGKSPESNGIINPAFLSTPTSAELSPNYIRDGLDQNWINVHNNNGLESHTSSWVYSFNQLQSPDNGVTHRRFEEYPINNSSHLSYSIDLNKEHERHSGFCNSSHCCRTILRLFVWCIIVISVLGIAISIGFIFYVERYANCDDTHIHSAKENITSIGNKKSFNDSLGTTEQTVTNMSETYLTTISRDEGFDRNLTVSDAILVSNTSEVTFISTQMPNITALNATEIPGYDEDNEDMSANFTTITYLTKSLFNLTEETNVENNSTAVIFGYNITDNFANDSNETLFNSSTTLSTTLFPQTITISPIDLASNDSQNNSYNNTTLNDTISEKEITTFSSLSSTILSTTESDFNQNSNHTENVINHNFENIFNDTSGEETANITKRTNSKNYQNFNQ